MAGTTFHADLLSSNFPYNFRELGSTIVMSGPAESPMQTPASMHGNDAERQVGYCQGYFIENVLPIARGYSSMGYTKLSDGPLGLVMDHMVEVRTNDNELIQIGVKDTKAYIALGNSSWMESSIYVNPDVAPQTAVVRGVSYLWFGTFVVYTFNATTQELELFNLPALGSATIKGIASGGSQLIVHDDETVYYSAVLDAQDFVPSLATGAGSTKVLSLRGNILCCIPLGSDFVIYTQYNAIHARSTGNLQFPFNYLEISGSIGIAKYEHVASNTNTGVHVVYTTAGFQQISPKGAEYIWPELSEGISRGILVDIDPITDLPVFNYYEGLAVRMSFVADRWICVSVGLDPNVFVFTDIYLFDIALNRWGRLKVTHSCVFQWGIELVSHTSAIRTYQDLQDAYALYSDLESQIPPITYLDITDTHVTNAALSKNRPALFSSLGAVSGIVLNDVITEGDPSNNGTTDASIPRIILGKYKVVRNHGIVFQFLRCNELKVGNILLHGHDYNGEIIRTRGNLKESPRHKDTWYTAFNADAISIEFQGMFTLTDLTVSCVDAGTMNSYATPLKKFDRLLLSTLYPVEAYELTGDITSDSLYARFTPSPIIEELFDLGTSLVSGQMRDIIQLASIVESDQSFITTTFISGVIANVSGVVNWTIAEPDKSFIATTFISGDMHVIVVSHTQAEPDIGAFATTFVSGVMS